MRVPASGAKNRFGSPETLAKPEPVAAGLSDTVNRSAQRCSAQSASIDKNINRAARRRHFETEFGNWIRKQNASVEFVGVPGADLRPW